MLLRPKAVASDTLFSELYVVRVFSFYFSQLIRELKHWRRRRIEKLLSYFVSNKPRSEHKSVLKAGSNQLCNASDHFHKKIQIFALEA